MNFSSLSPKQVVPFIIRCVNNNLVPFIQGSPGIGKSDMVKSISQKGNLKVIDLRLSQCDPTDLQGFPMRVGNKAEYVPFNTFPIEGDSIPEGYAGWLLFLDEFNGATKSVQMAAYKLILDRQVGQHNLHEKVAIVCAGNLSTDRAVTNNLSTAMQSRLIHFEVEADKKDWIEWALKNNIDSRIIAFIEYQPSKLHSFKPDHQDKTFASPRTWEFVSRLIKNEDVTDNDLPLISGTISEGIAVEFIKFCSVYQKLPKINEILADPENYNIPTDMGVKYATIIHLMEHTSGSNIGNITKYINRFSPEFQVIYYKNLVAKDPVYRMNTDVVSSLQRLLRFINDDS